MTLTREPPHVGFQSFPRLAGVGSLVKRQHKCGRKIKTARELTRNDVLLNAKKGADTLLLDVGVIFLESIGKAERYHWQASIVVCAGLVVFAKNNFAFALESMLSFLAMDITDTDVPAGGLQGFT